MVVGIDNRRDGLLGDITCSFLWSSGAVSALGGET